MLKCQILFTYFCSTFDLTGTHFRGKFYYVGNVGYIKKTSLDQSKFGNSSARFGTSFTCIPFGLSILFYHVKFLRYGSAKVP